MFVKPHQLTRFALPVCLALASTPAAYAAPTSIVEAQRALRDEIRFRTVDKFELSPPGSCPRWMTEQSDPNRCSKLTVLYRGVHLSGILIEKAVKPPTLTIYQVGHESTPLNPEASEERIHGQLEAMPDSLVAEDAAWFIDRLLERKTDLLILFMPGLGLYPDENAPESVKRTHAILSNHNATALLDFPGDSAAAYFIAHAKAFLDRRAKSYRHINMIGRSGGGWATTLAAAADSRISCSISFFGSLPMKLRLPVPGDVRNDLGDFEQYGLYLYKRLDYTDLYALASVTSRQHTEVYNEKDDCCFSGAVKGSKVAEQVAKRYGTLKGFHVDTLPYRSERDHGNLDESALAVVNQRCPIEQ